MKALVYQGENSKEWAEVPDPVIRDNGDAMIRIDAVTICGSDLHILKGDVPTVTPGRILGHEAVGTVIEAGSAVSTLQPRRPRGRVMHLRLRPLQLLPTGPLRTMPGRRRLDPRTPHRRRASPIRPYPLR
ncbi:MAG: alcohol dehydrogenase [Sphaerisporangium sp.]|nr:alcohol dehydrogenase [Sphaerisporangium sp.]